MDSQVKGILGPAMLSDGAPFDLRGGRYKELITADGIGRYAEAARLGELFFACNQAAQAVSVALTTTYTGIVIQNPPSSSKIMYILAASYALSVAPAAIAPMIYLTGSSTTENTHTAALTPIPALRGSANTSVAKVDSSATLAAAPVYSMPFLGGFTAAALFGTSPAINDMGGMFTLLPGGFFAIGALTAVTGFGGILWHEKAMNSAANP